MPPTLPLYKQHCAIEHFRLQCRLLPCTLATDSKARIAAAPVSAEQPASNTHDQVLGVGRLRRVLQIAEFVAFTELHYQALLRTHWRA